MKKKNHGTNSSLFHSTLHSVLTTSTPTTYTKNDVIQSSKNRHQSGLSVTSIPRQFLYKINNGPVKERKSQEGRLRTEVHGNYINSKEKFKRSIIHKSSLSQGYSLYTEEVKNEINEKWANLSKNEQIGPAMPNTFQSTDSATLDKKTVILQLPEGRETIIKVHNGEYSYFRVACKGRLSPLKLSFFNANPMVYGFRYEVFVSESLEKPNQDYHDISFKVFISLVALTDTNIFPCSIE